MKYNTPQEVSEELVISYPYEGGIDEHVIPYKINESSNSSKDSELEKIDFN